MKEAKYKTCCHCKKAKLTENFSFNKSTIDNLNRSCRECVSAYGASYREKNSEKISIKREERQKNNYENFLKNGGHQVAKKTCKRCSQEKEISYFYVDKSTPDQLSLYCRDCMRAISKIYTEESREQVLKSAKTYRDKNLIKCRERGLGWRERNRERCREKTAKWREENSERCSENRIKWRRDNKAKLNELGKVYLKERKKIDPSFKLKAYLATRLWYALKKQRATKLDRTMILVGCSIEEVRAHLESQFTKGMSWDNYGKWHVDHIKPCAMFDLTIEEEQRKCFHYSNLQPLWAEENKEKSSYFEGRKRFRKDLSA